MKLLISLFLFPLLLASGLMWGCAGFYYSCSSSALTSEYSASGHLLNACLYLAIGAGLPLAVFSTLSGILLAGVSFVFKSWSRAMIAMAVAGSGFFLWKYFLEVPYPG